MPKNVYAQMKNDHYSTSLALLRKDNKSSKNWKFCATCSGGWNSKQFKVFLKSED